ncbi:MAG: hypothetical protein JO084_06475 [Bradyrhizobiaceae bacterium]|nr:hypothetical protein [Hyphomicrobiales bacterium]MBV9427348.1 hypothetical protein [Bradyrhizobiaceae bacterium]
MSADKTLIVQAADEVAEISVLNSTFDPVARGVGRLQQALPTGVYKVTVRVGPVVEEQLVSLDEDRTVQIAAPEIPSPIPFASSTHSHSSQRQVAISASSRPRDVFGHGASIFIFARETTSEDDASQRNPAAGLSLLDENGQLLCDIEERANIGSDGAPCAGWRADVSPGAYRIRLDLPNHTSFERALVATGGKQTQLFMFERDYGLPQAETHRAADLAGGTVVICASDRFDPSDERARLTELAAYALVQKRRVLSDGLTNRLLDGKFEDPMQGLLGAHIILRDRPEDTHLFEVVTDNLKRLLGQDHPDVQALWLRRRNRGDVTEIRLRTPPMLRAGWDLATEESVRDNDLIPSEAPSGTIAFKVLAAGPWLLWRGDEQHEAELESLTPDVSAAAGPLADYLKTRARVQAERAPAPGALRRLNFAVRSLPGVRSVVGPPEPASPTPVTLSVDEKAELARTLGIPGNAIENVLKSFSR